MNNKRKKYVGSFQVERDAAVLYDKVAILTHGLKVSVISLSFPYLYNNIYRQKQILHIANLNSLKYLKKILT